MKILIWFMLVILTLPAGAQMTGVSVNLDAHLVSDTTPEGDITLLPIVLNVTKFFNGNENIEDISLDQIKASLFRVSTYGDTVLPSRPGQVLWKFGANAINFERQQIFFKEENAEYSVLSLISLDALGVIKVGDQFYVELSASFSPELQGAQSNFRISEDEYQQLVDHFECANCTVNRDYTTGPRDTLLGVGYDVELKVQYKNLGIRLFANNMYTTSTASHHYSDDSNNRQTNTFNRDFTKVVNVHQFGLQIEKQLLDTKHISLDGIVSYGLNLYRERFKQELSKRTYNYHEDADLDEIDYYPSEVNKKLNIKPTKNFQMNHMFKLGVRINLKNSLR